MRIRSIASAGLALSLTAGVLATTPARAADPLWVRTELTVHSAPPGDVEAVDLDVTLYQPFGLEEGQTVPLIFHSHGWGGSKTNSDTAFGEYRAAGFGVLSFTQRGFGATGGKAHVENIDVEGYDVQALVDYVAELDWVTQEAPGDPLIGAIGGSYGGGYQFVGGFAEKRSGTDRFDALAPEITWWDLKESLAPSGVVRTTWVSALYAAGLTAHTQTVHEGFAYGAATGEWPDGDGPLEPDLDAFFEKTGPRHHAANHGPLDIPVLFGQGTTDNLFNLNQGLKNVAGALTPEAREQSLFIGYNGGHTLPEVMPLANFVSGDPCSTQIGGGSFADIVVEFMEDHLLGNANGTPAWASATPLYNIGTESGECLQTADVDPDTSIPLDLVVAPSGVGVPVHYELAAGPIRVAGAPTLDATGATATGLENRAFFGLSVGTSPADAVLIGANVMPMRLAGPLLDGSVEGFDLPGVGVDVAEGQKLFLTVSANSLMFGGHSSRTPGAIILEGVTVNLPTV
jgi:hypothetical protein